MAKEKQSAFESYAKLEAARVKLITAMRLIDEAHQDIGESGRKIDTRGALIDASGALGIVGCKAIEEMRKIERGANG